MEITETKSDGLKRELKVVVPADDMERRIRDRLEEVGRSVKLPGFRPGKVPLSIIKQRYGTSVMGEVLEKAVSETSQKALADRDLRAAAQPKIEVTSFAEGKDLEYTLAVEIMPEITPVDFSKLRFERLRAEVTDAEIDKTLARLAQRQPRFTPIKDGRKAQIGDLVVIDFVGRIDAIEFAGGTATDFELELGSNRFVPGFEDQLVGAKAGETVSVKVTFPAGYGGPELAGKDAEFETTVKEIREPVPAAIDEQLAKDLGFEEGLEALRATVREQSEREYAAVSRARLKRALLDDLAAAHAFTLPEVVVESEYQAVWKRYEEEQAREKGTAGPEGAGPEGAGAEAPAGDEASDQTGDQAADQTGDQAADQTGEDAGDEDLRAQCRAVAERRVRLGLLLGEVGHANHIEVSQEELSKALQAEAVRHPGQEREVVAFFQKNPQAMESLRAPIFEDKVVDFILEMATVTERDVTSEELFASPDEDAEDTASRSKSKTAGAAKKPVKAKKTAAKTKTAKTKAAETKTAKAKTAKAKTAKKT